jgi:hypothetical protein
MRRPRHHQDAEAVFVHAIDWSFSNCECLDRPHAAVDREALNARRIRDVALHELTHHRCFTPYEPTIRRVRRGVLFRECRRRCTYRSPFAGISRYLSMSGGVCLDATAHAPVRRGSSRHVRFCAGGRAVTRVSTAIVPNGSVRCQTQSPRKQNVLSGEASPDEGTVYD